MPVQPHAHAGAHGGPVDKMMLAAPAPFAPDKPRLLQHAEMFRQPLSCQGHTMIHHKAAVDFEQGLPVTLVKLIKNLAPHTIRQRPKQIIEFHTQPISS